MLVFSLTAHEYAHGVAALREGDDTAYMLGRLTLNPLPHIDPWLSVILPALLWFASKGAFTFGGAKPIPVNPRKYHKYKRGDIIVSAAGVTTNLLIAVTCALLFVALGLAGRAMPALLPTLDTAQRMMTLGMEINLLLCFFNLIPIPPLDGSHLFYHLLPPGLGARYRSLQRFGFLPLMLLLLVGQPVLAILLKPVSYGMNILLQFVLPYAVGDGWNIFQS
ncbi:MAG TPA: site-2 protease family protein [Gemmatimonadales bacterium]|nr:site-2 protease family protein [Gemmatimonadales bacterium]